MNYFKTMSQSPRLDGLYMPSIEDIFPWSTAPEAARALASATARANERNGWVAAYYSNIKGRSIRFPHVPVVGEGIDGASVLADLWEEDEDGAVVDVVGASQEEE